MTQQIYQERDVPWKELQQIGLFKNGSLNLDEDDLKAMLSGRRTEMLRLENLNTEGLHIPSLDAKLSLRLDEDGVLELLVHPIYREAEVPQYLTDDEANALERGEAVNVQKFVFDDKGDSKEILVEFDKDTNEFIITDTEKIIVPEMVNNEKLSAEQKERYRKGKRVELADGTTFQYSGTNSKGMSADKLALVASILIDGGISYILYKGLHALFGEKQDKAKASDYNKGYYDALADMDAEEQSNSISR
jgi:Protein of unknown function (DUF4099)/Protein of unknown function (DUF3945)